MSTLNMNFFIVRNSIWIGLRKKQVNLTYVDDEEDPLLEISSDDLSYTDGSKFDLENTESKLGAGLLRGPCFALAANEELSLRDYKCTRESGFICQWKGKYQSHLFLYKELLCIKRNRVQFLELEILLF